MSEFCKCKTHEQRKRIVTAPFGLPLIKSRFQHPSGFRFCSLKLDAFR